MSWVVKKLGDLLKIQNGYAFDSKLFSSEGEMPLIRIRDIKKGVVTETRYTVEYDEKYVVKKGDLLIGMDGEFGCYEWKGKNALLNQRVCRLQNFESQIYPRFLLYGINSYLKAIEEVTGYTTVKHISSKQIANIQFPLPPLATQQKIVAKLDAIFAEIDKATAAVEANIKNAEALFQSYLTEVFENGGEGWEVGTIKKLCVELFAGGDVPKDRMSKLLTNEFSVPIFTNGEKEKGLYGFTDNARVVKPSITVSARGTIGYSELRTQPFYPAIRLIVATPDESLVNIYFLKYAIRSIKFIHSGASIPQLTVPMIKDYSIKYPISIVEQRAIVDTFDKLSDDIEKIKHSMLKKLNQLSSLKQSILKQAFNGELIKG